MKTLVKMVYIEGICMAKADSHVVREQCNQGNPKGPCLLCSWGYNNIMLPARDSWRVNTAHVSSFVLISILRGQPRTPPSGDNLGVLDYHLNAKAWWVICFLIISPCFMAIFTPYFALSSYLANPTFPQHVYMPKFGISFFVPFSALLRLSRD